MCEGQTPLQAASKIFNGIIKRATETGIEFNTDEPLIICVKDIAQLSFGKIYEFKCNRKKLNTPQEIPVKDKINGGTKIIIYEYTNEIKRIKKIDK